MGGKSNSLLESSVEQSGVELLNNEREALAVVASAKEFSIWKIIHSAHRPQPTLLDKGFWRSLTH